MTVRPPAAEADAPASVEPDIRKAAASFRTGDLAAAQACCLAILDADPNHFDALHLLGVLCLNRRAFADAAAFLHRAEQVRPDVAQLHANLGRACQGLSLFEDAARHFRRAKGAQADPALLSDMGTAVGGTGRYAEAEAIFRQALAVAPGFPPALYNLARCLATQDRHAEAIPLFRELVDALRGTSASGGEGDPRRLELVVSSLATSLGALQHFDEALAACRALLERQPQSATGAWNASLALLALGRYAEGWVEYEARWRVPAHDPPHPRASILDLDAVAGRSVLVLAEQGRGDLLQFVRYAPMLAERGAQVTLQVYADLAPVLRQLPLVRVITPEEAEPKTDFVTSLLSLPLAFGTTLQTVPAATPYLAASPSRLAAWRERLGPRRGKRIGLAWRGLQHIPHRSVPVAALGRLLQLEDVTFHTLQRDTTPSDQDWLDRHGVKAHGRALRDFGDTAALISLMDLVVTIDTSVAHLAGGLGAPVWVMLAHNADWRWLIGREDSPWYPTARLFRQETPGNWTDVMERIAGAI